VCPINASLLHAVAVELELNVELEPNIELELELEPNVGVGVGVGVGIGVGVEPMLNQIDGVKIYMVGGAVRDALLGLVVKDRDYVVVGATPQQMLQQGFRPVGQDFPVFLHPQSREEYALARTERKTAPGYRGFVFHAAPEVTLEQDLVRRDLTINAIAQAEDGTLSDPFGGLRDIEQRVFRHVSSAFCEDPVRILRLARFAARFADFSVAPETMALMQLMVQHGEVDALVSERVWQELSRALMEAQPSRMLVVLRECGALQRILPELDGLWGPTQAAGIDEAGRAMHVIDGAAAQGTTLAVRFAVLMQAPNPGVGVTLIEQVCQRLRVPNECRDLAIMTAREHAYVACMPDAAAIVMLFVRCDAFRKPARFGQMLEAIECGLRFSGQDAGEQHDRDRSAALQAVIRRWQTALAAARAIDAGTIALGLAQSPQRIAPEIHAARVAAVSAIGEVADDEHANEE
jgi:tRNA nucleotidyltransferase (CCA-adding enzyme)